MAGIMVCTYTYVCSSGGMIGYPDSITIHVLGMMSIGEEFPEQHLGFLSGYEDR